MAMALNMDNYRIIILGRGLTNYVKYEIPVHKQVFTSDLKS